jgi:hypothetical protein
VSAPGKFRYIAVAPGRVDGKHVDAMGKAVFLFDFLIHHQTDAEGRVYYGKPISYPWIEERFENPPPRRTLRRWMTTLRLEGYIQIRRPHFGDARMIVSICAPKKWPAPRQFSLFPSRDAVSIASGKAFGNPSEMLSNSQPNQRPDMAAPNGQKWPPILNSKKQREETNKTAAPAAASPGDCGKEKSDYLAELRRVAGMGV